MSVISVLKLPKPQSQDEYLPDLARTVRAIRLKSLQTDVESFITRYEDEVDMPLEFTQNRLLDQAAIHFFGVRSEIPYNPDTDAASFIVSNEIVAFLVLLDTSKLSQAAATERNKDCNAVQSSSSKEYLFGATYVAEEYRGQGIGKKMIQEMINEIQRIDKETNSHSTCELQARHGNLRAFSLYKSLGFEVVNEDQIEEKNGRVFHCWSMRLQL